MHYKPPELNSMVEGRLVDWWILHNNTMQQSQSQFLMIFSLWCGPVSIAVVTRPCWPCWPCWLPQISQICYEAGCQSVWDSETGDYMLHMLGLPDRQETRRPRHLEMFYLHFVPSQVSGLRLRSYNATTRQDMGWWMCAVYGCLVTEINDISHAGSSSSRCLSSPFPELSIITVGVYFYISSFSAPSNPLVTRERGSERGSEEHQRNIRGTSDNLTISPQCRLGIKRNTTEPYIVPGCSNLK